MKKAVKGAASNDLGNAFIWSAFKYFLRQPTDSYVVYSPVKYWKAQHLIDRKFIKGFAFNRRHFHTKIDACIMVALWANISANIDEFCIDGFDIDVKTGVLTFCRSLPIKRIHSLFSQKYYESESINCDSTDGILVGLNGQEASLTVKW